MKKTICLSLSCLIATQIDIAMAAPQKQVSQEELNAIYLRVFGKKQPTLPVEMLTDLKINDQSSRKIRVQTNTKKITHIQRSVLLAKLKKYLKKNIYRKLKNAAGNKQWFSSGDLARAGISISYNIMGLNAELKIRKSSMNRRMRSILSAGAGRHKIIPENLLSPADISAYVNFSSNVSYNHQAIKRKTQLNLRAASAVNVKGFVLENQFTFQVGRKRGNKYNNLRRDYTRLVFDDPDNKLRYKFGDINTRGRNFQDYFQIGGIQISKESIWSHSNETRPQGNYSFVLDSDSEVEIYQDGKLKRTIHLQAGIHTLEEIRANAGNQIRLRIKNEFGRRYIKTFNRFSDSRLLKPGYARYGLSLGVPAKRNNKNIHYEVGRKISSAYYQLGVSENLTVGFDIQTDGKSHLLGADAIKAMALGNLSVGVGYSRSRNGRSGQAIRVQLDSRYNRLSNRSINWSISAEHFSKNFKSVRLGSDNTENSYQQSVKKKINFSLSKTLSKKLNASLNLNHTNYYDNRSSQYATLGLNHRFSKKVSFSIYGSHSKDQGRKKENSINLGLNVQLGKSASGRYRSINTRYNTHSQALQTSYNIGAKGFYGRDSLNGYIRLDSRKKQKSLSTNIRYRDPRFDLNASHRSYLNQSNKKTSQTTYANLNTAIAFADGAFALSRPINDSFAILQQPKGLKYPMAASRGKNLFNRKSNNLHDLPNYYNSLMLANRPAVIGNLSSYRVQHISIDSAVLPEGLDPNATEFDVMPDYKSGYRVKVGGDKQTSFGARVLNFTGKPLALEGGRLVRKSDLEEKEVLFFTDKNGVMKVPFITPGEYVFELFNYSERKKIQIKAVNQEIDIYLKENQ